MQNIHSEIIGADGKQYDGEQAIISLTSWKARITAVGLTLFSLISNCPGFHIVLVLSTDEFPNKMLEMPDDIILLAKSKKIEILWVKDNYKSFKKVLFTMNKYRDIPIISADDDLIYCKNYAKLLYNKWKEMPTSCIGLSSSFYVYKQNIYDAELWGYAQLFPPHFVSYIDFSIVDVMRKLECIDDDGFYTEIRRKYHINAFSFRLPFNNKYIAMNPNATQSNCITDQRKQHSQNDKDIYKKLLR